MSKKISWLQNISFQWRGRTKEGVSRWWGGPKGPPEWFGRIFVGYGIFAGIGGLVALPVNQLAHIPNLWILSLVGCVHFFVFGSVGLWALHLRRNLLKLKSAEELAQEFGSTPETVQRMAEQHSIRPQININDVNLYNPQEFLASQVLLRGASAPVAADVLLRAAEPTTPQSAPETLLRAAAPDAETPTPSKSLAAGDLDAPLDVAAPYTEETESAIQELRH